MSSGDKWWRSSSENESSSAAEETLQVLQSSALQVLERIDSVPALIEALMEGGFPVFLSETGRQKYIEKLERYK